MPLLVEESAPRRVVVARRGGPHPREEPVHAPRPVALEAEDAAGVGDAALLRRPRRRRRAADLDTIVDGRQVVVAQRIIPPGASARKSGAVVSLPGTNGADGLTPVSSHRSTVCKSPALIASQTCRDSAGTSRSS